jgi:glucan biosynthesis protein C
MNTTNRRYDIDWLRVIAIGLLLLYHAAIGFQAWGIMLTFISNDKPWPSLWTPMTMLNIWRIPLLFFVSGMGVFFALQTRNWKQLLLERAKRILLPFVFGMFAIVPISIYIWQRHYDFGASYSYDSAHLWFLGNIFAYVVLLSHIFFYLKKNENGRVVTGLKKLFSTPLGLLPVIAAFIVEVILVNPNPFSLYAKTWHGFFMGLLSFFFGFCFVLSGESFWKMMLKWRWLFLSVAAILCAARFYQAELNPANYLLAIESCSWIFTVFAFGHRYLNHPSKTLSYLSEAVFPVYIVHMIFQALASSFVFSLDIPVPLQFILVLLLTGGGCFGVYEVIRRVNFLRPLFGLKGLTPSPLRSRGSSPFPKEKGVKNFNGPLISFF